MNPEPVTIDVTMPHLDIAGRAWYAIWDGFQNAWRLTDGTFVTPTGGRISECADVVRAGGPLARLDATSPGICAMWLQYAFKQ